MGQDALLVYYFRIQPLSFGFCSTKFPFFIYILGMNDLKFSISFVVSKILDLLV